MGIISLILLVPTLFVVRTIVRSDAFDAIMDEEKRERIKYYEELREIDIDMEIFMEQEEWGGMSQDGVIVNKLKRICQCSKRIARMEKHCAYLDDVERRYNHPLFGIFIF